MATVEKSATISGRERRIFALIFVLGLAVRAAILWNTGDLRTTIADEQHYSQIARTIVAGDGFAWGPDRPTSIRPPLYPGLLAVFWRASGSEDLQGVRVIQVVLSLATAVLVGLLGRRLYSPRAGLWAAAVCWLYPSLIFFDFLILTETLFTFLLVAFVLLTVSLVQTQRYAVAVSCGMVLGLAALTRSILWPLPLLLCPLLAAVVRAPLARRLALPALVLAGYGAVVAPWAVRNTRLQGVVTIVDTMGGINLRMGNYEHTPHDRMWDAVGLTGDKNWVVGLPPNPDGAPVTEGQKDKWAQRMAIEYMLSHPAQTIRRSFIKFSDFWGLEREFIAGVQAGFFSPPVWFHVAATIAIILGYVVVVTMGALGLWIAPPADRRMQVLMLLPIVLITGLHTVVFGHSRYHVPLMPLFGVYAAAFVTERWRAVRSVAAGPKGPALLPITGALATVTTLVAVWVRQVVVVDLARISALFNHAG